MKINLPFSEDKNTQISIFIAFAIVTFASILLVIFAFHNNLLRNSLFAFGVDLVLLFISLKLYIEAGERKYDNSYWYAEIRATALIVIALLLGDVLVGFAANPEMPLYKATISHIGFTITAFLMIFLIPLLLLLLLLAQVMCIFRITFFRLLVSKLN